MLRWLLRQFSRLSDAPTELDYLPVIGASPAGHEEKLKAAAERYGKNFRCAADGLPRETLKEGKFVPVAPANVTKLERKRKP